MMTHPQHNDGIDIHAVDWHTAQRIPVHVTNPEDIAYSHLHKCETRATFRTVMMQPGVDNVLMLAPYAPTRKRMYITFAYLSGTPSAIVITHSINTATSVAGTASTALPMDMPGILINSNNGFHPPFLIEAQSEVWAACFSDATPTMLSIVEEFEVQ